MSTLGDFFTGMVQRSRTAVQDRAALNTLAQYVNDQNEQQSDAAAQRGKQASAIRNVLKAYGGDDPNVGHIVNSMGVDQLEGILHGIAAGNDVAKTDSEINAQNAMAAFNTERMNQMQGEGDALSAFARALTGQLPAGGAPAAAASPGVNINGAVLNAMASMGKVNPRMAGVMLNKFLPSIIGQGGEDLTPGTYSDPVTGAHFAFRGKQFLPAGFDPGKTDAGKLVPQVDPDGNLMGFTMTDIRGHQTFHAYKGNATVKQVRDENGNPLQGFFMDSEGHPLDTRGALDKAGYETVTDDEGNQKLQLKATKPAAQSNGPVKPKVGEVRKGYRFKGGDPADKNNWEKVS